MPRKYPGFTWLEIQWRYGPRHAPQWLKNEYFYETLGRINAYVVETGSSFLEKQNLIDKLIEYVGHPKKLNWWQKLTKIFYL